jgi:hypothetical protein
MQFQIAPAAISYLSHRNSQRHREVNTYFFEQTSIPFINFRETEGVQVMSIAKAVIVADHESDIVSSILLHSCAVINFGE